MYKTTNYNKNTTINHNKHTQHSNSNGRGQLCALARAWIFKIDPAERGITPSYQSTTGATPIARARGARARAPPRPALMGAIPIRARKPKRDGGRPPPGSPTAKHFPCRVHGETFTEMFRRYPMFRRQTFDPKMFPRGPRKV